MFDRWRKLAKAFYSEKKKQFDISKVGAALCQAVLRCDVLCCAVLPDVKRCAVLGASQLHAWLGWEECGGGRA